MNATTVLVVENPLHESFLYALAIVILLPHLKKWIGDMGDVQRKLNRKISDMRILYWISNRIWMRKALSLSIFIVSSVVSLGVSATVGAVILLIEGPTNVESINIFVHGITAIFTTFAIATWFANRTKSIISFGNTTAQQAQINQIFNPDLLEQTTQSNKDANKSISENDFSHNTDEVVEEKED